MNVGGYSKVLCYFHGVIGRARIDEGYLVKQWQFVHETTLDSLEYIADGFFLVQGGEPETDGQLLLFFGL